MVLGKAYEGYYFPPFLLDGVAAEEDQGHHATDTLPFPVKMTSL